jgi:hypothetical protein
MPGSCCGKPVTRIIKVANVEAGLIGLDQKELLRWVRDFGNYISPSREQDYTQALLREYKSYVEKVHREVPQENARSQKS